MALQDDVLMNGGEITILWLGEGCSCYEHDKSLCVWCIKEWVSNGFVEWALKLFDVVIKILNYSMMHLNPCCNYTTLYVVWGRMFPSGGYCKTPKWVRASRS